MGRITLVVDDSVGKRWQSAPKLIEKQLVSILTASQALPGEPISLKAFKDWIAEAEPEGNETISIIDAKKKWAIKRKQLENFIR